MVQYSQLFKPFWSQTILYRTDHRTSVRTHREPYCPVISLFCCILAGDVGGWGWVVDLKVCLNTPRGPEERPNDIGQKCQGQKVAKQSRFEDASTITTKALWDRLIAIFMFIHFLFLWLHHRGCGISVPWAGIEPVSLALESSISISFFNTASFSASLHLCDLP